MIHMNWLTIAVIVFLVAAMIFGAVRGLVRMVMAVATALLAVVIVSMIVDPLSQVIKANTPLYQTLETGIGNYVRNSVGAAANNFSMGAQNAIDSLALPGVVKDLIRQGNTPENYIALGAANAMDFIIKWLTNLVFTAIVYVGSFILVRIALMLVTALLNKIVKLPVLKQMNLLAGACIGLLLGILLVWVGGLIVTAGAATGWGQEALIMIDESAFLSFLFQNNLLLDIIAG